MYDLGGKLLNTFNTTAACAEFFCKDAGYINHNLKYSKKIRLDGEWYHISRFNEKIKETI